MEDLLKEIKDDKQKISSEVTPRSLKIRTIEPWETVQGKRGRKKGNPVERKEYGKSIEGRSSYEVLQAIEEDEYEAVSEDESGDNEEGNVSTREVAKELLKIVERLHRESGGKIAKKEAVKMIIKAMGMDESE